VTSDFWIRGIGLNKVPEPARVTEFPKATARRSRDMPTAPRRGMHDWPPGPRSSYYAAKPS
jgi:hypothetical protein